MVPTAHRKRPEAGLVFSLHRRLSRLRESGNPAFGFPLFQFFFWVLVFSSLIREVFGFFSLYHSRQEPGLAPIYRQ
jgi:hypothetical protein